MSTELEITPSFFKALMQALKPSVYLLHSAVWRAGYKVNGIAP